MRTYRTKLKVNNKKIHEGLKQLSGMYRFVYNYGIETQFSKTLWNAQSPKDQLMSMASLKDKFEIMQNLKRNSFVKEANDGVKLRALRNSHLSYAKWYTDSRAQGSTQKNYLPTHASKKRMGMRFGTSSKVKVFYDYIKVPGVGKIKLYEKGYLPQGEGALNASFYFDGKNWWVTLQNSSNLTSQQSLVEHKTSLDIDMDGNLKIDGNVYENVIEKQNYKKAKAKKASLVKKYKRQKKSVLTYKAGKPVVRTTRNMMKTRNRIHQISCKIDRIKKDYFNKIANAVARTKPTELHILDEVAVRKERQGYLTRRLRESSTLTFLNILTRKFKNLGTEVIRHSRSQELLEIR